MPKAYSREKTVCTPQKMMLEKWDVHIQKNEIRHILSPCTNESRISTLKPLEANIESARQDNGTGLSE